MRSKSWHRMLFVTVALALTAGIAAAVSTADPVALLVKFQGDVGVERVGGDERVAGEVGLQLNAGDRVTVPDGGEAVVLYRTGKLVKAAASVTIEEVAEEASSSLFTNTVRTLGQVATTDARTQPNRQGMIRPIAGAPAPVSPRNAIKILSARPTFTWFSVDGTERYMIQLQRQGADSPAPVRYRVGSDTTWTLPDTEPALVPGATYMWTVGGDGGGRVADPKHFVVASSEDIAAVEETMNGLIAAGINPSEDGLFLTALAYRDAGLLYEAHQAIQRIEGQGNGQGRAFFMLKGDVLDALGKVDAAEVAFQMADAAPGG